ncbi:hypothetical protein [Streptomyces sp. 135]|uniref:hypothetical protein n=1 Tax=Streptomyces sp. 135 TaxID=2838850 RepID=UPI001CBED0BB|nr:hypothetical protein [Streptomyces sp. 135]
MFDNLVAVATGKHKERLVKAARAASVDLVCAGDTWRAIHSQCARRHNIVPLPGRDAGGGGRDLQPVGLTGPQLALMLTTLFRGARHTPSPTPTSGRSFSVSTTLPPQLALTCED